MSDDVLKDLEESGYTPRAWQRSLADASPRHLSAWLSYATDMRELHAISEKEREFIFIALNSANRWPHVGAHIKKARALGASAEEIVEVLATVAYLLGPHAWTAGLEALAEVRAEESKE